MNRKFYRIIHYFTPLALFFAGCSFEDITTLPISSELDDLNQTLEENSGLMVYSSKQNLNDSLSKVSLEIKNKIDEQADKDYQKVKDLIDRSLKNLGNDNKKFQFLCDENERWIYRCNLITGEIECFSMSSNKLRLLSSIK